MIIPTSEANRFQCPLTQKPCAGSACMGWHNLPPLVIEPRGDHHTRTAFDGEKPILERGYCGSFGFSKFDHENMERQIDPAKYYPEAEEREKVA